MGQPLSRPFVPTASDGSTTNMVMISFPSLCCADEINILYGSSELHASIRDVILRSWSKGIQDEKPYNNNFSGFKLRGKPFTTGCCGDVKHAMKRTGLLMDIIQDMMARGYSLRCTTNFKPHTKSSSFLFERVLPNGLEPYILAVDLESSDMLYLMNVPTRLPPVVENILSQEWGLSKQKCVRDGYFSYTLKRMPWSSSSVGENLAKSRYLLLQVIRAVHQEGYVYIAAGHPQQNIQEVDTIFFARAANPEPLGESFIFGLQKSDYVYLVDAPDSCVKVVQDAIENVWPKGLQRIDDKEEKMNAFKMKGYPWNTSGQSAVDSRKTLIHIFEKFRSMGWRLYATFDMNVNLDDVCTYMFSSCPPANRKFMAIKLGCGNSFRLINAPENVKKAMRELMYKFWVQGLPENQTDENLHLSFPNSIYHVHGIFTFIVEKVESFGWRLVSSGDTSAKFHADKNSRYPIDVHTLFFEAVEDSVFAEPSAFSFT